MMMMMIMMMVMMISMIVQCRVRTWKAVSRPGRLVPERGRGRTALFAEMMMMERVIMIRE